MSGSQCVKTNNIVVGNKDPNESLDSLGFTGFHYLDIKILSYIDDNDLKTFCILNTYLNSLCKDEILWKDKLEINYGEDIFNYVKNNFRLKYNFLLEYGVGVRAVNFAAKNGHLDILKWMYSINKSLPEKREVNFSAKNGHLDILKWVYEKIKELPDQDGLNDTAYNDHLEILRWVYSINKSLPNQDGVNFAAMTGNLDILKWVYSMNKSLPSQWGVINAAKNGLSDILKWVYSINKTPPDQNTANYAARNGSLETLKWVYSINGILPYQDAVNCSILRNDHSNMLEWLKYVRMAKK